jgi:hypothetical protein
VANLVGHGKCAPVFGDERQTSRLAQFCRGGAAACLGRSGRLLARPSQFEGLTGAKPFRISEGYPRVFTTEKGAATYFGGIWEALIRGGG